MAAQLEQAAGRAWPASAPCFASGVRARRPEHRNERKAGPARRRSTGPFRAGAAGNHVLRRHAMRPPAAARAVAYATGEHARRGRRCARRLVQHGDDAMPAQAMRAVNVRKHIEHGPDIYREPWCRQDNAPWHTRHQTTPAPGFAYRVRLADDGCRARTTARGCLWRHHRPESLRRQPGGKAATASPQP